MLFPEPISVIVPAYDTLHCAYQIVEQKQEDFDWAVYSYNKWFITFNKLSMVIVNFIEWAYLYYWANYMKTHSNNQFNI